MEAWDGRRRVRWERIAPEPVAASPGRANPRHGEDTRKMENRIRRNKPKISGTFDSKSLTSKKLRQYIRLWHGEKQSHRGARARRCRRVNIAVPGKVGRC